MTHQLTFKVHIYDTDCYGVMWHGSYHKWLEQARDAMMEAANLPLQLPGEGHVYPVVEQTLRYRKSAKLRDALTIHSSVTFKGPRVIFEQTITRTNSETNEPETVIESATTCTVCDENFKPFRRVPQEIQDALG